MTGWNSEVGRNRDEKTTAVNMIGAGSPAAFPIREDGPGNYTRNCRGKDYLADRLPPGGAQCETAFAEVAGWFLMILRWCG